VSKEKKNKDEISVYVELHNTLLGNNHTVALQRVMPPSNLFLVAVTAPVCIVSIMQSHKI
jgi:hypothetical protein